MFPWIYVTLFLCLFFLYLPHFPLNSHIKFVYFTSFKNKTQKKSSNYQPSVSWVPSSSFYDRLTIGAGKVRYLRNYFENLKQLDEIKARCLSSPDLLYSNRLTQTEQTTIMTQLKEWSEYGSKSREELRNIGKAEIERKQKKEQKTPISYSAERLNENEICTMCPVHLEKRQQSNNWNLHKCQSVPDFNTYCQCEHEDHLIPQPRQKFPETYVCRKKDLCQISKDTQPGSYKLNKNYPGIYCKPVKQPEPIPAGSMDFLNRSPCHRSRYQTLRNIKNTQFSKKKKKMGTDQRRQFLQNQIADDSDDEDGR